MESNHAKGTFQQLRIAVQGGLTCRLYALYYRIETIKSRLEVCFATLCLSLEHNRQRHLRWRLMDNSLPSWRVFLAQRCLVLQLVRLSCYIFEPCSLIMVLSVTATPANDVVVPIRRRCAS